MRRSRQRQEAEQPARPPASGGAEPRRRPSLRPKAGVLAEALPGESHLHPAVIMSARNVMRGFRSGSMSAAEGANGCAHCKAASHKQSDRHALLAGLPRQNDCGFSDALLWCRPDEHDPPAASASGQARDAAGLRRLLAAGAAARVLLLLWATWQDATMAVKYTDIDYQASRLTAP